MEKSDSEQLILVDEHDDVLGHLDKESCHDGDGVRHRAFSVFLFDSDGQLLIQQRAAAKRLWPGYWSNSVCSHPRRGEELESAAVRRVQQELGITVAVSWVYRFEYHARFGDLGSEHEVCSVFIGRVDAATIAALAPDPNEVAALEWVSSAKLERQFKNAADDYSPWFKLEWNALSSEHSSTLARFTNR